jgi:hypothetical protein
VGPYYCGNCGARQPDRRSVTPAILERRRAFDVRLIMVQTHATKTAKAHATVQREFLAYLAADGALPVLAASTPLDVIRFLMSKDAGGTTRVHVRECGFWQYGGVMAGNLCDCPKRAAATATNTTYGYLRAVFNRAGLSATWNPVACSGNPATAPQVEAFVELVGREQLASGVVRKRAPLLGMCIYCYLIDGYLQRCITLSAKGHFMKVVLTLRDALFLSVLWHTGLRAGDALRLLHQQIEDSFNEEGSGMWLLTVAVTKSARDTRKRRRIRIMDDGSYYSPLSIMRAYKLAAAKLGIRVHTDSMFRNVKQLAGGHYKLTTTASWAVMTRRFRENVRMLRLPPAITLHSPHGSLPRKWRDEGIDPAVICRAVDWTLQTFQYYTGSERDVLLLPVALALVAATNAM